MVFPVHALHPAGTSIALGLAVGLTHESCWMHALDRAHRHRCHPALSAIPNAAFYGGKLQNGCTALDRAPVLRGLPPLLFVEGGGQVQMEGGSSYNRTEVCACVPICVPRLAAAAGAAALPMTAGVLYR